jgi:hypothetical protein
MVSCKFILGIGKVQIADFKSTIVLAEYLFKMSDHNPTDWQIKGVAVAGYTVAVLGKFL